MHQRSWEQASRWPAVAVAVAVAVVWSVSCASQPRNQPAQQAQLVQAVSPPARLRPPEQLSETARAILKARMASHARDMSDLMSAIIVLSYAEIQEGALRVAGDASLSRPLTEDASELNSALPEKFFLYQDELRLEGKTLAAAAGKKDPFDVAESYGRLSQVCVRCHETYRAGR